MLPFFYNTEPISVYIILASLKQVQDKTKSCTQFFIGQHTTTQHNPTSKNGGKTIV